jgi:hypothetical protein
MKSQIEIGNWKLEIGNWKLEIGDWRLEIDSEGGPKKLRVPRWC